MGQEEENKDNPPRVFLTNLPTRVKNSSIEEAFEEHGTVSKIEFKFDADDVKQTDIAFVRFKSQETVDKVLELKTITIGDNEVEIKTVEEGEEELSDRGITKEDEDLMSVPREALRCHVCKRDRFASCEAFLNHKMGKHHQSNLRLHKSKDYAVLQLLKTEARLAAERSYDFNWLRYNPPAKRPTCEECGIQMTCKPAKHKWSTEHKMVKNFLNRKCCEIEFTDIGKFALHQLTIKHLKTVYEKKMKKAENEEDRLTMKKAIDIYKKCDADLKELKEEYGDLDLTEDLPPFDNKPIGLNYIVKKINYYCICCDQKFFPNPDGIVEPHCRSYTHYNNMIDLILEREKSIAAKTRKRKMDEADAEEKPTKKPSLEDVTEETKVKKDVKTVKKNAPVKKASVRAKVQEKKEEDEEESDIKQDDVEMADEEEEEFNDEGAAAVELEDEEEMGDEEEGGQDYDMQEVDDEEEVAEEEEEEGVQIIEQEEPEELQDQEEVQELNQEEEEEQQPAVEETPEVEEEEVVEEPQPKPARGRRGRGRGRGRGAKR